MRFSNWISLVIGAIETSCFVWACYGFPNLQYAFEKKKLFMSERCTAEEIACTFHIFVFQYKTYNKLMSFSWDLL